MQLNGKHFVLAGKFSHGDKFVMVRQMIEMCGGEVKQGTTLDKNTNFVVVGNMGNTSWVDGISPQEKDANDRSLNGQNISVISEDELFALLENNGITVDKWLVAYKQKLNEAKKELEQQLEKIEWSFDEETKTLLINDVSLPDFLANGEDYELTGINYRVNSINNIEQGNGNSEFSDDTDSSYINSRTYEADDIKCLMPWSKHIEEIKHINAPNLLEIPPAAFAWTTHLEEVFIPKVRIIRSGAFYYCKKLTTIYMPSIIFIGNGSFAQCQSLTDSFILGSLEYIGPIAFSGCKEIKKLSTACPDRVRADGKLIKGAGFSLKAIGKSAFLNCKKLESVLYDKNTTMVDSTAFYGTPLQDKLIS